MLVGYADLSRPTSRHQRYLTVVLAWVIGYMSARHALSSFRGEEERSLLSLIWGFVLAELAWLAHHWTIAYSIYNDATAAVDKQLMIPQVALVATLLGFVVVRWYESFHSPDDKKAAKDARAATIFAAAALAILLIFFNGSLDITSL